jgi:osmoprotectant transport system permease protein
MNPFDDALVWLNDPLNWTNPDGIVARTVEHLELSAAAVALGVLVSWPLGIWLGHTNRGGGVIVAVANLTRALPTVAMLTMFMVLAGGFGLRPVVLALAIFAVPPLLANAYLGGREVDPEIKEVARGMGMSAFQIVRRVEVPLAVPFLASGFRTAAVQIVATATLASFVNGGGLGMIISHGFALGIASGGGEIVAGGGVVILLCLGLEGLLALAQRWATPRHLRPSVRPVDSAADAPLATTT